MTERRPAYLAELDPCIERAVLTVLEYRIGRDMAISRAQLRTEVARLGFPAHERVIRATVNSLRKAGHLICSTGGEGGGYWMGMNWQEVDEFITQEVHARLVDLAETEAALKRAAEAKWGPEQFQLF